MTKRSRKASGASDRWVRDAFRKKHRILGRVDKRLARLQKTLEKASAKADAKFQEKTADLRAEIEEKSATLNKIRERFVKRLNEGVKEERDAIVKLTKQRDRLKEQLMALSGAELADEELDREDVDDGVEGDVEELLEETEDLIEEGEPEAIAEE